MTQLKKLLLLRNKKNIKNEETINENHIKIEKENESSFLNNDASWVEVVRRQRPQNCPIKK